MELDGNDLKMLDDFRDRLTELGKSYRTAEEYYRSARLWLRYHRENTTTSDRLITWSHRNRSHGAGARLIKHITAFTVWREKYCGIPNPYRDIQDAEHPRNYDRKKIPDPPSAEQIKRVIDAEPDPQHRLLIACAYALGLRNMELCGLNICDVRPDHVRILGKGNKERIVPLPQGLRDDLNKLAMYRLSFTGGKDDCLFTRWNGGRLDTSHVTAIFRHAGDRCGMRLHAHLLRHAYATHLIQAGCPVEKVAVLMGHSNISTTWKYTHIRVNADDVQIMGGVTCS
jgi:site-specific recombinase XerD